jgi:hypothetical protein
LRYPAGKEFIGVSGSEVQEGVTVPASKDLSYDSFNRHTLADVLGSFGKGMMLVVWAMGGTTPHPEIKTVNNTARNGVFSVGKGCLD